MVNYNYYIQILLIIVYKETHFKLVRILYNKIVN